MARNGSRPNSIEFDADESKTPLQYGDLSVTDATGTELTAHMRVTPSGLTIAIADTAASYSINERPPYLGG